MSRALGRYRRWMIESALPFWASDGFDAEAGRFHERLDAAGRPIDVPHRSMVQARQIYVFSHAARLGWFPEGGPLAERAAAALVRDYCDEGVDHASFAFSIDRTGTIVSTVRDAYAHAFQLFALASLHLLNGDRRLIALADKIVTFMDRELFDPVHGGLFDAKPAPDTTKRQNPVMHLLEAYLFLERAAPGRGYLERAGRLVALLEQRFLHPGSGVLIEYFEADWSSHSDAARAGVWEPGHHFEWVWLLEEYAALSGHDTAALAESLYRSAKANGIGANGLIFDELSADFQVTKPSNRLWPHTEAIKAAMAMRGRDPDAPALADRMAQSLLDTFLDRPFAGGWIDHFAADGRPLVDYVPASSLYHLFLAASEACTVDADAAEPLATAD